MTKIEQKIPEGWSVKKGAEIATLITKGASPKWQGFEYCTNGVLFVTSENVRDGFLDVSNPKFLPIEFSMKQKRSSLHKGDILINIVGASIGRSCIYNQDVKANINQAVCLFRVNSLTYNSYVNLYLSLPQTIQTLLGTQTESARPNLSLTDISNLKFLLPPLPEQEKIAGILSCWDDGIEKLSALIEKKKIQKKALMQQLLTGKHRLKGFSSPWHEVKLGNVGTTYTGLSGKDKESFGHGKPYIPYLNIYQNFVIDTNQFELVAIKDGENQNTVKYGDIFFTTSSETPDEVGISSVLLEEPKEETYLNSFCFGFRLHDFSILLPFYAAYLCRSEQIRKTMYMLAQGATRFNLSKTEFLKSYIYIPSDIAEQKAIAEILSKADEEIELLNKKLEAFKQEKKALMQQLLTGKIRVKVN